MSYISGMPSIVPTVEAKIYSIDPSTYLSLHISVYLSICLASLLSNDNTPSFYIQAYMRTAEYVYRLYRFLKSANAWEWLNHPHHDLNTENVNRILWLTSTTCQGCRTMKRIRI